MSDISHESGGAGPSHRAAEIGVACAIALLGGIAIIGSLKVGVAWGAEGPGAGFFPFYIGIILVLASAINLARVFRSDNTGEIFATWSQIRQVVAVVVPTAVYVAAIPFLGMYLSSFLLVALFMRWLGKYGWTTVFGVAAGVTLLTFFMFEKWFLVPLPKGPVEAMLGF